MRAHRSTHMRSQDREAHSVRACAVEIHMDMSQEPFCMVIYFFFNGGYSLVYIYIEIEINIKYTCLYIYIHIL